MASTTSANESPSAQHAANTQAALYTENSPKKAARSNARRPHGVIQVPWMPFRSRRKSVQRTAADRPHAEEVQPPGRIRSDRAAGRVIDVDDRRAKPTFEELALGRRVTFHRAVVVEVVSA